MIAPQSFVGRKQQLTKLRAFLKGALDWQRLESSLREAITEWRIEQPDPTRARLKQAKGLAEQLGYL